MEVVYQSGDVVNVIRLSKSANVKLGGNYVIQTYHLSIDQIRQVNFSLDGKNCLDCPLSYENGDGKCYTHKGMQRLGMVAMLKRLNKFESFDSLDMSKVDKFINKVKDKDISLVRFGAYGEPTFLDLEVMEKLSKITTWTGYTHTWNRDSSQGYSRFLMASTHNIFEVSIAEDKGWRVFNTNFLEGAVNCPASKESGRKSVCSKCALCGGTKGKSKKNIFINLH